jgi:hypothetical protein
MSNGKKRRREIISNIGNKCRIGHNVEWENMSTGNNVECNKCRMGHNVEW